MEMRSATADDADAIAALWVRVGLVDSVDGRREEIVVKLERDAELFVVADDGGRLVASAMGTWDGHRGWVKRVAVDPDHRRRGLGSAVVAELESRFLSKGVTRLRLAIWHTNESARAFWASLGWQEHEGVVYAARDLDEASDDAC